MDLQLKGKRAFISGSTAGIGLAIASLLAREGAEVTINGRNGDRVSSALAEMRRKFPGSKVAGYAADLGSSEVTAELIRALGETDILVNNLGIYEHKEFSDITDADWLRIFEINVMSGVRLSRAFLPGMLKRNWGRIIFISSESGVNIPAEMIHYGMTKSAQLALARGLAETTAGSAVTVNSVLPGPTRSEGVGRFILDMAKSKGLTEKDLEREFFTHVRPSSLLKRFAETDEVANLVAFVASPLASAINGAALRVEGGVVRSIV